MACTADIKADPPLWGALLCGKLTHYYVEHWYGTHVHTMLGCTIWCYTDKLLWSTLTDTLLYGTVTAKLLWAHFCVVHGHTDTLLWAHFCAVHENTGSLTHYCGAYDCGHTFVWHTGTLTLTHYCGAHQSWARPAAIRAGGELLALSWKSTLLSSVIIVIIVIVIISHHRHYQSSSSSVIIIIIN